MKNNSPSLKETKTGIFAHLAIVDLDCDPDKISEQLGVEPSETWRAGDFRFKGTSSTAKYNNSGWQIESQLTPDRPVNDHIETLLSRLTPGWDQLKRIAPRYHIELALAIYLRGKPRPELHLDAAVLKRLAEVNAHIDIDLI